MTLDFPNECRSYDAKAGLIRFWGYDTVMEVSFFLEVGALSKLNPQMPHEESAYLAVFDAALDRIHKTASKAYSRSRTRQDAYLLAAADF